MNELNNKIVKILEGLVEVTQPFHRLDGLPPPHVLPQHYEKATQALLTLITEQVRLGREESYYMGYTQSQEDGISLTKVNTLAKITDYWAERGVKEAEKAMELVSQIEAQLKDTTLLEGEK